MVRDILNDGLILFSVLNPPLLVLHFKIAKVYVRTFVKNVDAFRSRPRYKGSYSCVLVVKPRRVSPRHADSFDVTIYYTQNGRA